MTQLSTVVVLNGPPNCGKDTLADMLVEYGLHKHQMKEQLYIDTAKEFGVDLTWLTRKASDRVSKEVHHRDLILNGMPISPRQALIFTSENIIKPNHGDDYYGQAAVNRCRARNSTLAVFSDGGFQSEIEPLQKAYHNVIIFRLHREGHTFEGDSRAYLEGFDNTYDISLVDGKPTQGLADILAVLDSYIGNALKIA